MSKPVRQALACGLFLAFCAADIAAHPRPRVVGEGSVLATIPQEAAYCAGQLGCNGGYPEGVAVVDDRVYVTGPATFGTAGKGPSLVTVIRKSTGRRLAEIPIVGENTAFEHALSGIAPDHKGNVYVLSTQLGVVRITRRGRSYTQTSYATAMPHLPICTVGGALPCSPTPVDLPPLANEMTFDDDGWLYVTDSLQATIFRVPPGGGTPEPWFQSPLLAGNLGAPLPFGTNGIKVSPDRDYLYVVETFDPTDARRGHVYRIPLVDQPDPAAIERFATFPNSEVPDSLVFGKSGRLYVSLAGSNQIAMLDEDGAEITRISGPVGSPIPFDGPATMAFDDASKSLLVANHAIFGNPANWAVLRVVVDEKGDPYPGRVHHRRH